MFTAEASAWTPELQARVAEIERSAVLKEMKGFLPIETVERLSRVPGLVLVPGIAEITPALLGRKITEGISPQKLSLDSPCPKEESQRTTLAELWFVVQETIDGVVKPKILAEISITFSPAGGFYRPDFFVSGTIFATAADFTTINLNKLRGHGIQVEAPNDALRVRPFTAEIHQQAGNLKLSGSVPSEFPPSPIQIRDQMETDALGRVFTSSAERACIEYVNKKEPGTLAVGSTEESSRENVPTTEADWVQQNIGKPMRFHLRVGTTPRLGEMNDDEYGQIMLASGNEFEILHPRTNRDAAVELQSYEDLQNPTRMAKQLSLCFQRCYSAMDLVLQCMTDCMVKNGDNKSFETKMAGCVGTAFKKEDRVDVSGVLKEMIG